VEIWKFNILRSQYKSVSYLNIQFLATFKFTVFYPGEISYKLTRFAILPCSTLYNVETVGIKFQKYSHYIMMLTAFQESSNNVNSKINLDKFISEVIVPFSAIKYQNTCYWEWLPPLWSSDQSSWLQIQRSGFVSQRYQIFWEVVRLEQGPLSLVSIIEELLEWKSSSTSLENRD
jgi:hypothetical protein